MKKNSLTTAVVAGIAGVAGFAGLANAVDLNPDGLGQVLIYPYYTVNKSQATMFSVVNTANVSKAVKVRFLEGYNSREVLDFNLFLSPHDVWTGAVTDNGNADGGAVLFTSDTSCTSPVIPAAGVPFRTLAFTGAHADGGPTDVTRTREGYLELISMGDITPGSALDVAVTHKQNGTPNGGKPACGAPVTGNNPANFVVAPTGGLFGAGAIVNVGTGTFFPYNADAIDGFSSTSLWASSGSLTPSLLQANSPAPSAGATAYVFQSGKLLTLDYVDGIDAVSAVFTADAIYNEFLTDASLGATTDWVVGFPTKRFYVDEEIVGPAAIAPFVETFDGASNVVVGIKIYDREEGSPTVTNADDFSPPNPGRPPSSLPFEVNVISFLSATDPNAGHESGVFGSTLVSNIPPYGASGWMRLDLASGDGGHALRPATNGNVLHGLPVTGFEAYNVINANAAPGVLANYGGMFRHRASRICTNGAVACS